MTQKAQERMELNNGGLKVAIMGSPAVGKTAILNRFFDHVFSDYYEPSGGDMYIFENEWDEGELEMQVTDVPGGDEFDEPRQKTIEECDAFVLVYSVDDAASFREVARLREMIFDEKQAGVPVVVVETKADLPRSSWFKGADAISNQLETGWAVQHLMVSAKAGSDMSDIFQCLVQEAQLGLRRPSRGTQYISSFNAIQNILGSIPDQTKKAISN
ncbi:ras-like protein rasX [Haliotis rubra]|uniref:ras-like protein rasX n=1 Tax=Haliotis rubra TaxID=36100 RepID=UPI001EE5E54E|nr:ras-like protein rasX [Haliotis rubra]